MKINELITKLQAIEKEHGDVELYIYGGEAGYIDKDVTINKGEFTDRVSNNYYEEIGSDDHWVIYYEY